MRGWLRENVKLGDNMKTQVEEHEGPRCNSRIACVRTIIERDKTRELRRISKRQEGIKETVQITKGCDYIPMQLVLLVLIIRKDRRNNSRICFYVHTYIHTYMYTYVSIYILDICMYKKHTFFRIAVAAA